MTQHARCGGSLFASAYLSILGGVRVCVLYVYVCMFVCVCVRACIIVFNCVGVCVCDARMSPLIQRIASLTFSAPSRRYVLKRKCVTLRLREGQTWPLMLGRSQSIKRQLASVPPYQLSQGRAGLLLCAKNSHATQEDQASQSVRAHVLLLGPPPPYLSLSLSLFPGVSHTLSLPISLLLWTQKNGRIINSNSINAETAAAARQ